ncbi:MAG: hypothetical protein JEZ11_12305 [Desulfobacterales bacterium]|nr:hypothetical protein [Desulfobacterales bacterium]
MEISSEQQKNWDDVRRAARALAQAGDLITEASRILDRFCHPTDPDNWDRAFAWKLNELKLTIGVCREVEQHLSACANPETESDASAGGEGRC